MPGLFGIIDFTSGDHADTDERIRKMCAVLSHTPDYVIQTRRARGLQASTIGRIDLPTDCDIEQPVTSADGRWTGFLYGEVFDDVGKRRRAHGGVGAFELENDARYLLELYLAHGRDAFGDVSGSFVVGFIDNATGVVVILNDRQSFRPLYYALSDEELIFAPEIKGILAAKPRLRARVDRLAIGQLLAVAYPAGNRTLFEDVKAFPAASEGIVADGTLRTARYWDMQFDPAAELQTREAQRDAVVAALREQIPQIALHRTDGLRVGAMLSGGMDSRAIVGLVSPHRQISTHHFGVAGCPETPWAEAVAKRCGTDHHVYEIEPEGHYNHWPQAVWTTEGMICCFHFHHSHLVEPISRLTDVLLNGQTTFSDTVIKDWMLEPISDGDVPEAYWRSSQGDTPPLRELFAGVGGQYRNPGELERAMADDFTGLMQGYRQERPADWCQSFYTRNRLRRLVSYALNMHGTAMRVKAPFFGNVLVDTMLRLPVEARVERRVYIDALPAALPELSAIPCSTNLGHGTVAHWLRRVGSKLRREASQRAPGLVARIGNQYPPYEHFMRTLWREHAERLFMAEDAPLFEYVNRDTVRDAWQRHLAGKHDYGYFLHQLFTISLWHDMFIEQMSPDDLKGR